MEDLKTTLLYSLQRYYDTLNATGFAHINDMQSVLILSYIYDLLESDYSYFVTDSDMRVLGFALNCIKNNSCIVYKDTAFLDLQTTDEFAADGDFRIYHEDSTQLYNDNVTKIL